MPKQRFNLVNKFTAEGNKGGDTLDIELLDDGRLRLEIGHCCVRTICHTVPVEFVTSLLTRAVIDNNGGVKSAMRPVSWPKEFIEELVAKIEIS